MAKASNIIKIQVEDAEEGSMSESDSQPGSSIKTQKVSDKKPKMVQKAANSKLNFKKKSGPTKKTDKKIHENAAIEIKNEKSEVAGDEQKDNQARSRGDEDLSSRSKLNVIKEIEARHSSGLGSKDDIAGKTDGLKNLMDPAKPSLVSGQKGQVAEKAQFDYPEKAVTQRSVGLYKKIALSFIILTLALLAVVGYYSLVKATIVLIPNQERISNNMIVDIKDKDKGAVVGANSVVGAVAFLEMAHEEVYQASGTQVIGEEAVGKVRIINNYSKNQPLVASTRLLAPDGVRLYRLKSTVNVPAGGSAEVDIYADAPSPEAGIEPTKFTIPGLWAGLQDKIYAENDEPIVYRQKIKRTVTSEDIDQARQDLKQKLMQNCQQRISESYKDYSQAVYRLEEGSIKYSIGGRVGEEKDEFAGQIQADIVVAAFNSQEIAQLARQKFASSLPSGKEVISFDEANIIYSLNNYSLAESAAAINVTFEGKASLKENSNIIEVDKILGLSQKELDAYLSGLPDIAGYEVKYYPSFIKRVPSLSDRIKVEIRK